MGMAQWTRRTPPKGEIVGSSPTGDGEKIFFSTAGPKRAKSTTPCVIQIHNLQIRSLTRCSVAPTGQPLGQTSVPALGFHFFLFGCHGAQVRHTTHPTKIK